MRGLRILLLPLLLVACGTTTRDRTTPLPTEPAGEEAKRLFAEGSRAFREKRYDDAAKLYEKVVDKWPGSVISPDAEFWAAESLYRDGELYASYLAFRRFLEIHSLYSRIDLVEQRLYQIGVRRIREGRSGLLGLGIFTTSEQGVEALNTLVQEFPEGRHADDALLEVGRYQRSDRDLPAAVDTFKRLLERYPRSEWAFQARLLLATSYREINRGEPYDPGVLRLAREQYVAYASAVRADPARAAEYAGRLELADRRIREIDETLGGHELLVAQWYLHLEQDDAAAYYLTRAASIYSGTEAGKTAAELLRSLGREVPEPGAAPSAPPAGGAGETGTR